MSTAEWTEERAFANPDAYIGHLKEAEAGKVRLEKWELRLLALAAFDKVDVLFDMFPAEAVPEEIEGAWREIRSNQPLVRQVEDYLNS